MFHFTPGSFSVWPRVPGIALEMENVRNAEMDYTGLPGKTGMEKMDLPRAGARAYSSMGRGRVIVGISTGSRRVVRVCVFKKY